MSNRHNAFVAEHLRPPTPEEARGIAEQEREDRRQQEAERHEREVKRIYMSQPGATESGWATEKAGILAKDRAAQMVKQRDATREQLTRSYRRSF